MSKDKNIGENGNISENDNKLNIIFYEEYSLSNKLLKQKTSGGIEVNTEMVIKYLRKLGHNVSRNKEFDNGVRPDIVVSSTFGPLAALFLYRIKKKYKCACVQHAHTTIEDMKGGIIPKANSIIDKLVAIYLRKIYSFSHVLITPTSYSKKCLENMGIKTKPIIPVSNGIEIDKFKYKPEYRKRFREFLKKTYNIGEDARVIVNVGVVWDRKAPDVWYKTALQLPEYYFVWVGPKNNNKIAEKAESLPNVFFTGYYPEIVDAYYGGDLFFYPSYVENQGIPLIEAAACKIPIVARDIEPFEWLKSPEACLKGNTIEDFVNNIKLIFNSMSMNDDPTTQNNKNKSDDAQNTISIDALTENAYKLVLKYHDFSSIIKKVVEIYRAAIRINKKFFI
ncbi:MAG: glycosyltransferase family 4 protein [Promethearchaeota archaeon]